MMKLLAIILLLIAPMTLIAQDYCSCWSYMQVYPSDGHYIVESQSDFNQPDTSLCGSSGQFYCPATATVRMTVSDSAGSFYWSETQTDNDGPGMASSLLRGTQVQLNDTYSEDAYHEVS